MPAIARERQGKQALAVAALFDCSGSEESACAFSHNSQGTPRELWEEADADCIRYQERRVNYGTCQQLHAGQGKQALAVSALLVFN